MHGQFSASIAFDLAGHDASHPAGRDLSSLLSTKTMAKKTTTTV